MEKQPSRSNGKERDKSTALPHGHVTNNQTGRGGYNPQIQGKVDAREIINMGPSGGDMPFKLPNERTPMDNNTILPQGHDPKNQTGGGGYNPQIQGKVDVRKIISMGPSGGNMRFKLPKEGTPPMDNNTTLPHNQIGRGGYNPQIQGEKKIEAEKINEKPSGGLMSFDPPKVGQGYVTNEHIHGGKWNPQRPSGGNMNFQLGTNIQTGRFGYNPQIQGEIIKANKIHMGPSGSGSMSFDSTNGQTLLEDNSRTLRQGHVTNNQADRGGHDPHIQGDVKEKEINMDRVAAGRTPNDKNKTPPKGHIKNDQTGGGGYNPQIQGQINAGEIKMGPSDSSKKSFKS